MNTNRFEYEELRMAPAGPEVGAPDGDGLDQPTPPGKDDDDEELVEEKPSDN